MDPNATYGESDPRMDVLPHHERQERASRTDRPRPRTSLPEYHVLTRDVRPGLGCSLDGVDRDERNGQLRGYARCSWHGLGSTGPMKTDAVKVVIRSTSVPLHAADHGYEANRAHQSPAANSFQESATLQRARRPPRFALLRGRRATP
jgi:hypothetical protein